MEVQDVRANDLAANQPTKSDMDEDLGIDATPEALVWTLTRGGPSAERQRALGGPIPERD